MSKIAVVTGGSRGLGKDMALALAKKGIDVVITYHSRQADAEEVLKLIEAMGQKAASLRLDVSSISDFGQFWAELSQILKTKWNAEKFDFLIHNAGMGATIPIAQMTEEVFDQFVDVHFKGVYFLSQKALTLMNDHGGLVFISSGASRFCVNGYSVYAAMKSAIETFSRYLAKEYGNRGIRSNVVAPGPIETDFNDAAIRSNPQMKSILAQLTPLGRVGYADDIGSVVAFLCTDDAKWVNAQRIEVSGGINI